MISDENYLTCLCSQEAKPVNISGDTTLYEVAVYVVCVSTLL